MTEYCRLCAELKDPMEIVTEITDAEQLMEQKLWTCCQWTTENIEHYRLPHRVCAICLDKLDKCWLFSRSVQLAQQRLLEIFQENEAEIDTKPLITALVPRTYDPLEYPHSNSTSASIPFETPASEFQHSEYYPIDGDANGQPDEFNDLNEDTYAAYYAEDNKDDIVLIETQNNVNDGPKISQVETYPELKCCDCGQQFPSKQSLKRHYSIHTGAQPYECWLCHKMFRLNSYLSEHMLIHLYTPKARIRHANSRRWKRAKRISSRQNPKNKTNRIMPNPKDYRFLCDECGRAFRRKWQLIKHHAVHTTDRPHQCECGRRYKYKSNLYLHRKRSHHSCGEAKRIDDEHDLLSDIENSLDYKISALFSMILTGQDPDTEVNDKQSIGKISNGLRACPPFRCTDCGKEFTMRRGLVKHRRLVHTSGQPIECGHCGKFFKHENSLRRHRQLFSIDISLNPFPCEKCDRTFLRESWLVKHRQSHVTAVERPHQTETVEYGRCFKDEYTQAAHYLNQSNECRFECWLCHELFGSRSFLEKHFAIHMMSKEMRKLKAELIYHHC